MLYGVLRAAIFSNIAMTFNFMMTFLFIDINFWPYVNCINCMSVVCIPTLVCIVKGVRFGSRHTTGTRRQRAYTVSRRPSSRDSEEIDNAHTSAGNNAHTSTKHLLHFMQFSTVVYLLTCFFFLDFWCSSHLQEINSFKIVYLFTDRVNTLASPPSLASLGSSE